jgi:hypothetical protein
LLRALIEGIGRPALFVTDVVNVDCQGDSGQRPAVTAQVVHLPAGAVMILAVEGGDFQRVFPTIVGQHLGRQQ